MRKRRSRPWLLCFLGREASLQCPGCRAPAPPHCLAFEEMLRPVLNCERGAVASQGSHQSSLGQSLRRNYRATASSETRICGLSPSTGLRPECSKGRWAGFGVWSVLGRTRATSHRQIAHVVQSTSRFLICTPCCSEASKTRTRGSAPGSARHCSAMRDFFLWPLRRAGLENPPLKHGPRQVLLFTGSFLVGTRDVVAAVLASVKLRFAEIGAPPCRADAAGRPSRSSAPLLHLLGYTKQKQSKFRGGSCDCRARCRHSVVVRAADIRLARRSVPFLAA